MDITNYINQKNKCCVFNLTKNRAILNELNLADYPNSDKYKKSINCANPKGFSQKAHCAGRKKK